MVKDEGGLGKYTRGSCAGVADSMVMCGGIEYQDQKIYFPQPDALLPVRLSDGQVTWITWGRRKDEAIGKFPKDGWARLNSIKSGK